MYTTFNYEIYFDKKMTDDEMTLFCNVFGDALRNQKLLIWEAIGEDFIKGFVDYGQSGMSKEDSIKYFTEQLNKLDYKLEIKNVG